MGIHQAKNIPNDPQQVHYLNCYKNLIPLKDAFFLHAVKCVGGGVGGGGGSMW